MEVQHFLENYYVEVNVLVSTLDLARNGIIRMSIYSNLRKDIAEYYQLNEEELKDAINGMYCAEEHVRRYIEELGSEE